MNSSFFSIILLIVPIVLIFLYIKKKKKGNSDEGVFKKRRDGDEVWKTIKRFLKENNEIGKEVVESYVAKRPSLSNIDKSLPKDEQKRIKLELKELEKKVKDEEKRIKKSGKKLKQKKEKEIYVVLFVTRNAKNIKKNSNPSIEELAIENSEIINDPPRAIECEVTTVKLNKKETKRDINVLREVPYEIEAKWILPIKEAEEQKLKKEVGKKKEKKKPVKDKEKKNTKKQDVDKWKKKEETKKAKK
ncbi:MAG: DUF5385 family protein [Malacoplasma sp.]